MLLAISPKGVFWTPDEGAKWLEMQSVRIEGDLRYSVSFPAQRVDTELQYLPHAGIFPRPSIGADGLLYLGFETPVVFPLMSKVGFWLFGVVGVYLIPLLSGWLTAVIAGVLADKVRAGVGAPALLLVGLGTPVWFYSELFWEHTAACCLALIALAFVALAPPLNVAALLAALVALSAAAALRLEVLAFAAALVMAWAIAGFLSRGSERERSAARPRPRRSPAKLVLYLALPAAVAATLLFLRASLTVRHHTLLSILPERIYAGVYTLWQSPWSILDVFVHTSISEAPFASDAWVLAAAAGIVLCVAAAFMRRVRWEAALLLPGVALVSAFSLSLLCAGETYRALHGFVPIAPFVVVAPYAWSGSREAGRSYVLSLLWILAGVHCVTSLLAISTSYIEIGRLAVGIEWGQRYMLTLYVVMAVLAAPAVTQYWRSPRPLWLRRIFVGAVSFMALTAVAFQIRGNAMLYLTRVRLAVWEYAMRGEGPIVTDVWWLPAGFAVFYTEHEVYYVYRRADVGRWAERAAPRGVHGFTFVSFFPAFPEEFGDDRIQPGAKQARVVDGMFLTRFVLAPPPVQPGG
jgi:hypothetical protein